MQKQFSCRRFHAEENRKKIKGLHGRLLQGFCMMQKVDIIEVFNFRAYFLGSWE